MTCLLVITVSVVSLIVIFVWVFFIEETPFWELAPEDVEQFAVYFGGVMTPVIAFLSLLAFLRTLAQQQYMITQQEHLIEQQKSQLDALKVEAEKEDLFQAIERLDQDIKDITRSRNVQIAAGGSSYEKTMYELLNDIESSDWRKLPEWKKFGPREEVVMINPDIGPDSRELLKDWDSACQAAGMLKLLGMHIDSHDRLAKSSALSDYYSKKYQSSYYRLIEKGYLEKEDMPIKIQEGTHYL